MPPAAISFAAFASCAKEAVAVAGTPAILGRSASVLEVKREAGDTGTPDPGLPEIRQSRVSSGCPFCDCVRSGDERHTSARFARA